MKTTLLLLFVTLPGLLFSAPVQIQPPPVIPACQELATALETGDLPFFAVGSYFFGYRLPGLDEGQMAEMETKKRPIVARYSNDPEPIGADASYWEAVEKEVSTYNKLVYLIYQREERSKAVDSVETP
ncbi:MAG: hypothetical protein Q7P63_02695 [Verrucomicrobiota bacterium JB022]|nr:hypothetical protein [Verrucomicrobiota bacterium JB022]